MTYTPSIIYTKISKNEGYLVSFPNKSGYIYQMFSVTTELLTEGHKLTSEKLENDYKVKPIFQFTIKDSGSYIIPFNSSLSPDPKLIEKAYKMFSKYDSLVLSRFASLEAIAGLRQREFVLDDCDDVTAKTIAYNSTANEVKTLLKERIERMGLTFDQEKQLRSAIDRQKQLQLNAANSDTTTKVTAKAK